MTTDTHFGHKKLIQYGRPENFEQKIFKGLAQLKDECVILHLGDFAIGNDEAAANQYYETLQGKYKILVRGNHDKKSNSWYLEHGFDFVCQEFVDKYFGKKILFKHIPAPRREGIDFQIHGHTHGDVHRDTEVRDFYDPTYHLELALEKTNYQPVNLERFLREATNV